MIFKYIWIFCFLLSFPSFAQEQSVLFFNDYVDYVIERLPDIQLNKLKRIQTEAQQMKSLKQREWNFELRSGLFQESDFTGNIDSPFIFQSGWELAAALNKTFVNIGGRMNLDFIYRQFTARGIVDGITEQRDFFVPTLTFQYAQPLLKNAFGVLDRMPIALAGLDQKITDWTVEEENAYLLSNYKKLYMQWVVYAQIHDFLMESLENAEQLERLSQDQRRVGYIDEVDYQNAKMLVLEIQNELLDVESVYTNLLYQISYIAQDTNIQPDLQEWNLLRESVQKDTFTPIDFTNTRQALILDFMRDKLRHSTGALRNSRLPEFNALLSVAMEVYATNATSQVSETLIVPAYYAGLQFKYPLGDMDYRANLTEFRKNSLEYDFLVQKYNNEFDYKIQEKVRNLTFYREKIDNRQAVREALQRRYNFQYRSFTQGRSVLAQLIETRNKMLNNRIEEADVQLRLIFEYFDFKVMNNEDEIARGD
ncbi:MAG: TolC family protein [Brevinema sp.]